MNLGPWLGAVGGLLVPALIIAGCEVAVRLLIAGGES